MKRTSEPRRQIRIFRIEPRLSVLVVFAFALQHVSRPQEAQASLDNLELLDRYWRSANYLSVGQIYLLDNPLLREPLQPQHIKPRRLGHWGTTPGLNFIYAHLNRVIRKKCTA